MGDVQVQWETKQGEGAGEKILVKSAMVALPESLGVVPGMVLDNYL